MTGRVDFATPVDVASAATTLIGAANSNAVDITGNVEITAFDTVAAGIERNVLFVGTPTLTHSANLTLPGSANIAAQSGDLATFRSYGGGIWRCTSYTRAANTPALITQSVTDSVVGRLLKVGDFGLGSAGVLEAANLNNLSANGFYITGAATLNVAFGAGTSDGQGYCIHQQHSNTAYATQIWTQLVNNWTYIRTKVAGTWSAWTRNVTLATAVGTVSQSSGVPTGAVIESGSNANGTYTKFADGTMICSRTGLQFTATANVVDAAALTFPANFIQVYHVGINLYDVSANNVYTGYARARFISATGFSLIEYWSVAQTYNYSYIAIGRWF